MHEGCSSSLFARFASTPWRRGVVSTWFAHGPSVFAYTRMRDALLSRFDPNNSVRTYVRFESYRLQLARASSPSGGKRSPRYLPIAVTSAPNCIPKPERSFLAFVLSLSRPFSLLSSSFSLVCKSHVDLDLVSPRRISRPADHSYDCLSRGLPRLARNSRSFDGGRHGILIGRALSEVSRTRKSQSAEMRPRVGKLFEGMSRSVRNFNGIHDSKSILLYFLHFS